MQHTLIVFLNNHQKDQPSWCVVDDLGVVSQCVVQGNQNELALLAVNKTVIVVIPSIDVVLEKINLPKMNENRFLQAIPFALEDQLFGEPESLHFAASGNTKDVARVVAIIAHEKMQSWLQLLKSWSLDPDQLVPSIFTVPYSQETWSIILLDDCLVRMSALDGFACDSINLFNLLELSIHASQTKPIHCHVVNTKSESLLKQKQPTNFVIHEQMASLDNVLAMSAQQVTAFPGINLLQGRYSKKRYSFLQTSKVTKMTAYLAAAWIVLLFLYPLGSYLILKQHAIALENEIAQIYKKNFPQASRMIAPKLRMQEKLDKQNNEDKENQPFLYFGLIGKGLGVASHVELKRLDYQNKQVTLELIADTSSDFSEFTDYLTQQGLTVRQQNANLAGSRINATLLIE
jgi:general secretion pathway protein L